MFIVGTPRSGSTLISQLLARCFEVAYVSNRVAPYWLCPIAGWERVIESHGRPERASISVRSRHGSSSGPDDPHEFGYFFRTWMDLRKSDQLSEPALARCDWSELRSELGGLAGYFDAALVVKNLNAISFQIDAVAAEIPESRFLHVHRAREETVQSILRVRASLGGDIRDWWSIRPAEYREWSRLGARDQVELQVDSVRSAVESSLSRLDPGRSMEVPLELLQNDPRRALEALGPFLGAAPELDRVPVEEVQR